MKNYRDRQIYIGREEIDYVAYKCLEDEFQIIPVKDPEEYQENDFIQRAENKEVTIPNWIIDVYGLDGINIQREMDEKRIVHCKAKKQKDFQIPKQLFVDQAPRHKMTSIGIYKAGAGRLSLPYMFFEEAMITVHRHLDYMELDMIKCEERKCLPYLEELSDFGILHDFYGKSLQNIVGSCYYYRVVGKTIPIPKQFAKRDIEVFISDHASHKVYLIPVDSISASEETKEQVKDKDVDDSILQSLQQIMESSKKITEKYEQTRKMKEEIEEKQKEFDALKEKMLEILN